MPSPTFASRTASSAEPRSTNCAIYVRQIPILNGARRPASLATIPLTPTIRTESTIRPTNTIPGATPTPAETTTGTTTGTIETDGTTDTEETTDRVDGTTDTEETTDRVDGTATERTKTTDHGAETVVMEEETGATNKLEAALLFSFTDFVFSYSRAPCCFSFLLLTFLIS